LNKSDTRRIFFDYHIEIPSKDLLDFIHRIASEMATDNPEVYRTFLPSALLATGNTLSLYFFHLSAFISHTIITRNCSARISRIFDGSTC
jgi:hypothetical protein